jgi:hypothetical protein
MYHIIGLTPEASTGEIALGGKKPAAEIRFGAKERQSAYENVTSGKDPKIDFVMLGCPHYNLEQIWRTASLLDGKKVHPDVRLWIFTAQAIKTVAERMGYAKTIHQAGGILMTDTCPAIGMVKPAGARVAAVDSCKQAHYMPPQLGIETWFGSMEECIDAALSGQWRGGLT